MLSVLVLALDKHWGVVQVDVTMLSRVLGFFIPVLVALLARRNAPPAVKAILNAVLVVVAGLVSTAIAADGEVDPSVWLDAIAWSAITSWASYYGLWKPTTMAPRLANATKNFGVGGTAQSHDRMAA